uniref:Uncharacterized protein n=2 Tax=Monodon monoceros TaxID=40151 RepID=A0A8C6AYA4_MONMO
MIPSFQANRQWTWFQRITQEEFSHRFWICFYLFYAATIILLLGGVLITLFSGHTPFSLVKTMIVTGIVFFFLTGLMYLHEANKISAFIQEKFSRSRSARDPCEALEMEEPTVIT